MDDDIISKTVRQIESIFEDDGSEIREQFILAGLLLTIFERFKTYVVDHVDGFFADTVEFSKNGIKYNRSEKFKKIIKDKGANSAGQHANAPFRASLRWFLEMDAITKEEFDDVERLYSLRNEIGHEMLQILGSAKKKRIEIWDVLVVFSVYVKIVRWWWKEVEATTDPDFDQDAYNNTDWDAVETTETILLREILNKALSGNHKWENILNIYKMAGGGSSSQE